ncbi:unnamed protein product [Amoebophrya sp. A25]|nr:unnamed protein product [Amoebophrya sp. A25]|eukprot:GSA25T00017297001.1
MVDTVKPSNAEEATALLHSLEEEVAAGNTAKLLPAWFEEQLTVDFEYSIEQDFAEHADGKDALPTESAVAVVSKVNAHLTEGGEPIWSQNKAFYRYFHGKGSVTGDEFLSFAKYLALRAHVIQQGGSMSDIDAIPSYSSSSDVEKKDHVAQVAVQSATKLLDGAVADILKGEQDRNKDPNKSADSSAGFAASVVAVSSAASAADPASRSAENFNPDPAGGAGAGPNPAGGPRAKGPAASTSGAAGARSASSGPASRKPTTGEAGGSSSSRAGGGGGHPTTTSKGGTPNTTGGISNSPEKSKKASSIAPPAPVLVKSEQIGGSSSSAAKNNRPTPNGKSVTRNKSPENKKIVPFRTSMMPLPGKKLNPSDKIHYPKPRVDPKLQIIKGSLKEYPSKNVLAQFRVSGVLEKKEAIETFQWLEEDVKNVYALREKIGDGMPEWLEQAIFGQDFAKNVEAEFRLMDSEGDGIMQVFVLQEVVRNVTTFLTAGVYLDTKGIAHHFKKIYPPAKNMGIEDFVEACKFLIARSWLLEQMGGRSPKKSPEKIRLPTITSGTGSMFFDGVTFPKWDNDEAVLVTQLKNEISWLHAQLSDQRRADYQRFATEKMSTATRNTLRANALKPSEFWNVLLPTYTREDLLMEIRHLQLDLEFYKAKATNVGKRALYAENLETKNQVRDMGHRIRYLENQLMHKEVEIEHGASSMFSVNGGASTFSVGGGASTFSSTVLPSAQTSTTLSATNNIGGGPSIMGNSTMNIEQAARMASKRASSEAVLKLAQEALRRERSKRKYAERRLAEEKDSVCRLNHQAKLHDMEIRKLAGAMAKTLGY